MNVPYFIVRQKNEEFFVMKFKAIELKERLDFHFREPYSDSVKDKVSCEKYIDAIRKKGLEISGDQEGVQRRVQLSRINKIAAYLNGEKDSYFPNSVVLAADVSDEERFMTNCLEDPELPSVGTMELPDSINFQIVDGQHRLAGLYVSDNNVQQNFEIFAVVLFNATKHTCAKIFRDINGNQATVNKSGLFDLLDLVNVDESNEDLCIEKNLHLICKQMNEDSASPLYGHIKMMGIGSGAISQAFFVQRIKRALNSSGIDLTDDSKIQYVYNSLFFYFSAFQRVFPGDWPVITKEQLKACKIDEDFLENNPGLDKMDFSEVREMYSNYVLKTKKSQLLKTNGFGAIIKMYPEILSNVQENTFEEYLREVSKLKETIDWSKDEVLTSGTGVKITNLVADRLIKYMYG